MNNNMKPYILTLIALIGICAYADTKTTTFKPNPKIEKKVAQFTFDITKKDYSFDTEGRWHGKTYCFKVADVKFEEGFTPIYDTKNPKKYLGFTMTLIDCDGDTFDTKWAMKKVCKEAVMMADVKKGKKKLWAIKSKNCMRMADENRPMNTELNLADYILVDEYEKSSLFQKDKEDIAKQSEPLKKSDISVAMFKADLKTKPIVVEANVKLDDYYNYSFSEARESHWSVRIWSLDEGGNITSSFAGYVRKNSTLGKKIINIIQDGKEHKVLIKIAHPPKEDREGDVVSIEGIEEIK